MPVIPALGRQRQEDCNFETSLGCIAKQSRKKREGRRETGRKGGREEGRSSM
jgi:hypothetical protein